MNATRKHDDVEALKSEFESLRADVAALAESLNQFLNQQSSQATGEEGSEPAPEEGQNEWEVLRQRIEAARAGGEQAARELRAEVQQHPLTSVGIALGLGYLLARMLR